MMRGVDGYLEEVGKRLCELRSERGWTQDHAAREVGVSVRTWGAWEAGHRAPQETNWERIGAVFQVEQAKVRGLTEDERVERYEAVEHRLDTIEDQLRDLTALVRQALAKEKPPE